MNKGINYKEREAVTMEAMLNPQVGDRFTELYCFWMYIVSRVGNAVITIEASAPCTFPTDGKVKSYTLQSFNKRFSYGSIDGYWIELVDRDNNTSWMKDYKEDKEG